SASTVPGSRGALLSYTQDSVLPSFWGVTETQFTMGLDEDITNAFTPSKNLRVFQEAGMGHVLWFNPNLMTGGVSVQQFVTLMVTDSASWASVGP
ncbi:MAG TPA: hypothetical protein VMI75_29880, partial [Polyangiaceae bacterium]|nr:hypothetical protein [Polyangiaceae bacterium]